MKILASKLNLLSTAGALMLAVSVAHAATGLPPIQRMGDIDYVTGGVGQTESSAIERASHSWPLTLEFAVKDKQRADFVSGVSVEVRDAGHHVALKVKSDGPFVLAKLQPGQYVVDASFEGKTLHEKVIVASGHPAKAVFEWPAGTGEVRS
ncbi:carboxypeptidase regulatory-like domain-containing protein [Rhodoferax sp.]|uniref:carboxypeptidase regulatory-like domain-containing protein n=1 Tax=Rhodoferax sp. TaxID=50421 RepID=UPI00283BF5B5|nr:carboxypeptidase regulatory-like domain-containing protein [Rhodoferax sp.]MDR3370884.1 carboxypeptidase regulatory-like domain-containing protein [Rhodoferax sp.]